MTVPRLALGALFFLSGLSALVYQVVWQRLLSTVFGVTVFATSTVLASFMAGLALGGLLGGLLADRLRRPLLAFAAAEAGVGLLAAATPAALDLASTLYSALHERAGFGLAALTAARLLCSLAVLTVPTTLMGATFPLVVASRTGEPASAERPLTASFSSSVSVLYALNTLGALAGALLAGYFLIGGIGLRATLRAATLLNLTVALGAVALALRSGSRSRIGMGLSNQPALERSRETEGERPALSRRQGTALLAVFAASGFVALGLEVVWFRMLLAYLPTTSYAFTTMLATILAGIGIGGLAAARGARRPADELLWLGTLLAATGASSVLSANLLARTYSAGWRTSGVVQACVVAMLPATVVMGLAYPRGLALWASSSKRLGWRVGAFSAANLGGAILGALAAGFLVVPAMGTRGALLTLAGSSLLAGAVLTAAAGASASSRAWRSPALLAAVFAAGALTLEDPFAAALARRYRGETSLWREEAPQATVAVHLSREGRRVLYIDGMHQASDSPEMTGLHRRIGLLPLLLHPKPRRALVIGLAGGTTPGTAALDPELQVDIVELSGAVVRASELFRHVSGDVLRRPNVRLRIDDGRNHLLLSGERYDIITADLVQPFHAGAGHLYSIEYFRLCRRALTDSGLMVQWIGHPPEAQYKLILRTFLGVFPETTLWAHSFLVGATAPLRLDRGSFERARRHPELAAALDEAGSAAPEALLALYTAGPQELRRFAGQGEVLSDDRPLSEYYLSLGGPAAPVDLTPLSADPARLLMP